MNAQLVKPRLEVVKNGVRGGDLGYGKKLFIEDVIKAYPIPGTDQSKTVLDNVDLQVSEGELIALVGPSGCGKSTLLRLILGEERATSGTLLLDGKPLGYPDDTRGIVYQKYTLFPHLSVVDNILLGYRMSMRYFAWRKAHRELRDQAMGYLATAKMADHAGKYPSELSGGQQQRVAVLQALIKNPKILLMDEPFGALDPGTREDMQVFLLKRWEETGKTIFFVTHDLEEAVYLATRVIVLSQHYTDDRGEIQRGARIVYDIATGVRGKPNSTDVKRTSEFGGRIQDIRERGFNPNHRRHIREFNLGHEDSFHTPGPRELNEDR